MIKLAFRITRLAVLASIAWYAYGHLPGMPSLHIPWAAAATSSQGQALSTLSNLPVKGRAPMTGYDRDLFGPAWKDTDRNGCDTRNDILARDLASLEYGKGGNCVVTAGTLNDPYTGKQIAFTRGRDTSMQVQIDHSVALGDAWQKGAQQLDSSTREQLANDPLNLLAVDGPANMRKGMSDAASWLPPNKSYRCAYVARQIAVKAKYRLWVTSAEKSAMARILESCPGQPLPS